MEILVFDMSGVFLNKGMSVFVDSVSEKYNIEKNKIKSFFDGNESSSYRKGLIKDEDFWKNIEEYLNINADELRNLFFTSYEINIETANFILKLKEKGYKTGFITNSPGDRFNYLSKKYDFDKYFDIGITSFDSHSWKPEKEIFLKFIKKYNLDANDITFIDDKESNLFPAKELGIKTIHFKDINSIVHLLDH